MALQPHPEIEAAYDPRPLPAVDSQVVTVARARLVGDEGAVIDAETGTLLLESALGLHERVMKMSAKIGRVRLLAAPRHLRGPAVALVAYRSANYFHFLVENLSRLFAFSSGGTADLEELRRNVAGIRFVLAEGAPVWQQQLLGLLRFETAVLPLAGDAQWLVDPLLIPTLPGRMHPAGRPVIFSPPVLPWLRRILREAAEIPEGEGSRRLYIRRRPAGWRLVVNETEVERVLAGRGFEVVEPEGLTVRDQIVLFAKASHVVSPHGAGLANLLATERCVVIELVPPRWLARCYYTLADALGHDYWYLVGRGDTTSPDQSLDYEVPIDELEATLAAASV
jgi:capsular polysaccharide biosynthesis protein